MRRRLSLAFVIVLSAWFSLARAEDQVRVFAAASLTNALTEAAARWQAEGHRKPSLAFGGSSLLARQVEAGAPADLFASADKGWMDYLESRGLIERASRIDLLGNELVLIAPAGRGFRVEMNPQFPFAGAFSGKLCTGEPGVVPVGIYAREALESLQWWESLKGRVVGTDDVRTALAFVERGDCATGVVYATDAAISPKVQVIARFPAGTHRPIVYPFAVIEGARPEAREFLRYLRDSAVAAQVFQRHGFVPLAGSE